MPREYVIWKWTAKTKHAAWLSAMRNIASDVELTLGQPYEGAFPEGVEFPMGT